MIFQVFIIIFCIIVALTYFSFQRRITLWYYRNFCTLTVRRARRLGLIFTGNFFGNSFWEDENGKEYTGIHYSHGDEFVDFE